MDKRGEERIFTIWWFVAIVAVSAVIVLSVMGFYSKDVDTKKFEATLLYEKIMECLTENGFLRNDFGSGFDIYKSCNLNEEVFSKEGILYFNIALNGENIFEGGDKSLAADCSVSSKIRADRFPGCVNRSEDVLLSNKGKITNGVLNVVAVSNQESGNYNLGGKNE